LADYVLGVKKPKINKSNMHYLNCVRIYSTLSKLHLVLSKSQAAKKNHAQLIFHSSNPGYSGWLVIIRPVPPYWCVSRQIGVGMK